jgi:hypothetical protein
MEDSDMIITTVTLDRKSKNFETLRLLSFLVQFIPSPLHRFPDITFGMRLV